MAPRHCKSRVQISGDRWSRHSLEPQYVIIITGNNVKANSSSLPTYDPRPKTMYQAGNIQRRKAFMSCLETDWLEMVLGQVDSVCKWATWILSWKQVHKIIYIIYVASPGCPWFPLLRIKSRVFISLCWSPRTVRHCGPKWGFRNLKSTRRHVLYEQGYDVGIISAGRYP